MPARPGEKEMKKNIRYTNLVSWSWTSYSASGELNHEEKCEYKGR